MKSLHAGLIVVCTFFGPSIVCAADPVAAQVEVEKEIRILEQQEVQAVLAQDAAALERLWDKAYVVHNPQGKIVPASGSVMDRPVLQNARASFTREVESIIANGDVVLSMGSETVAAQAGEVIKRRYTNIWMRKDGTWKMIARHANRICGRE
jgi:ketosteroid isomerase-like protein